MKIPTCHFEIVTIQYETLNNDCKTFHLLPGTNPSYHQVYRRGSKKDSRKEIQRTVCGAPLSIDVTMDGDYDSSYLEVNWVCAYANEIVNYNNYRQFPITVDNLNEWLNHNLERMEEPPQKKTSIT